MKPIEEYMLFTKTETENIVVLNPSGVRSAQCNAKFEQHLKLVDEPLVNTSIGGFLKILLDVKISSFIVASDKAWVEDSPVKKAYKSIYIDSAEKEEQTQFVFIILITLFIIIIVCCIIEVYRTDRAHKRRIERETDESIILSKEQAKQMQEAVVGPKFSYRPVSDLDNEVQKKPAEPLVGILKNGSLSKQHSMPEGEKLTKNTGISGEQNLN